MSSAGFLERFAESEAECAAAFELASRHLEAVRRFMDRENLYGREEAIRVRTGKALAPHVDDFRLAAYIVGP